MNGIGALQKALIKARQFLDQLAGRPRPGRKDFEHGYRIETCRRPDAGRYTLSGTGGGKDSV